MKRRLVTAVLVALAVWPLLQFGLVRSFDADAWKLAGFAMYSAPGPLHLVRVVGMDKRGQQVQLHRRDHEPELQRLVLDYTWHRRAVGRLASDRDLARHLLDSHPDWKGVAIVVGSPHLDRKTARVDIEFEHRAHWRDDPEGRSFHLPRKRMLEIFSN